MSDFYVEHDASVEATIEVFINKQKRLQKTQIGLPLCC